MLDNIPTRNIFFDYAQVTPAIVKAARDLQPTGLLVNAPRPNLLRFMPALNVTREEIDRMIELLQIAIVQADA